MKKFLGLIFVTGIVQKPKLELYWSMRGIFQTPIFSQTMSRNRFQLIQRYLHFNDNNAARTNEDRLYKIRVVTLTPTPPKCAPKNDTPGRLDGKLQNHKLVHIPPTKSDKMPKRKCHVCVCVCVCEKISRKKLDFPVLSVVFFCIQKAATYNITR